MLWLNLKEWKCYAIAKIACALHFQARPHISMTPNQAVTDSDNGLSLARHRAVVWINIGLFSIGNIFQRNWNQNTTIFVDENDFENVVCKMSIHLPPPQCFKILKWIRVAWWCHMTPRGFVNIGSGNGLWRQVTMRFPDQRGGAVNLILPRNCNEIWTQHKTIVCATQT